MRNRSFIVLILGALCAALAACGGSANATATALPRTATSVPAATTTTAASSTGATATAATATAIPTRPASTTTASSAVTGASATTTTATPTPAPTRLATSAPTMAAPTVSTVAAASRTSGEVTVNVTERDFAIALDTSSVPAGIVTFDVKNNGPSPHNFHIMVNGELVGTNDIDPGTRMFFTIALKPGSYDYLCTIPGHAILGMKGTLTVT